MEQQRRDALLSVVALRAQQVHLRRRLAVGRPPRGRDPVECVDVVPVGVARQERALRHQELRVDVEYREPWAQPRVARRTPPRLALCPVWMTLRGGCRGRGGVNARCGCGPTGVDSGGCDAIGAGTGQ